MGSIPTVPLHLKYQDLYNQILKEDWKMAEEKKMTTEEVNEYMK